MSYFDSNSFNELCQGLPEGLVNPFRSWFTKQLSNIQWNIKDHFYALKSVFKTESKALRSRTHHRTAFARLAVDDGYFAIRMAVTVANCVKSQTRVEYTRQFDSFDHALTNSRKSRLLKPLVFKKYELTQNFNLHRHYVTFIRNDFHAVQVYCELVAKTLRQFSQHGGNILILIELPSCYKSLLVKQKCIKPYARNRWIWHNQQALPKGRKLSIAFLDVKDTKEDAVKAMGYAAKGDKIRALALSIGENKSLLNSQSPEQQCFWGLYRHACEILMKKDNIEPWKGYVRELSLTALCSSHKKRAMYLTPYY
uniref:hypothetical protein n=1 Tax=Klebsormidium dissectum TaxID=329816 RepID=UPI00286A25F7|nr:hypothetical protein RMD55_pgp045 [Klebsormidium dissectum]YP_010932706.1 hypothetical protein RMD55_pgp026 [Klebsormidium dissectum]WKT06498.1 hypothetical protein [Klebsormidium dissectum]WKT06499.1 hypothetical protein [Klebsormidium dissectum]